MKKNKIIYWISTLILAAWMIISAVFPFLSSSAMEQANKMVAHWEFPQFFHIEWEIAKILGSIALVLPFVPGRIKEFSYHGFIILLVSAIITHVIHNDPLSFVSIPVFFLIVVAVSYTYFIKLHNAKNIGLNSEKIN